MRINQGVKLRRSMSQSIASGIHISSSAPHLPMGPDMTLQASMVKTVYLVWSRHLDSTVVVVFGLISLLLAKSFLLLLSVSLSSLDMFNDNRPNVRISPSNIGQSRLDILQPSEAWPELDPPGRTRQDWLMNIDWDSLLTVAVMWCAELGCYD